MIITHDFHLHTNLSLCAKPEATLAMYAQKAAELGLTKMAITNHMWDHAIPDWQREENVEFYEVQDFPYVAAIRDEIDQANHGSVHFLFGCEAEYSFENRRPAISPDVAEQMEVLLIPNSHTHLTMPKTYYEPHRKHIEYMIDAFMDIVHSDVAQYVTAIPHPFMAVCCPYDNHLLLNEIKDDEFKRCFTAAAEKGIALEINPNFIKNRSLSAVYDDPIFRMYRIGKECGCQFTVGTDAHGESGHDHFALVYLMCELLELREEDFHPLTRMGNNDECSK